MDVRILLKNTNSKCNKDMLEFLHSNIKSLKKKANIKVIIVYDEMYPSLKNVVKKLPTMVIDGTPVAGNKAIMHTLSSMLDVNAAGVTGSTGDGAGSIDLQDYWNAEMHSNMDDECDEDADLMDQVKRKALDQSMEHKDQLAKKEKRRDPIVGNSRQDNLMMGGIVPDKISDMIDNDPIMQRFWENQEETPGM